MSNTQTANGKKKKRNLPETLRGVCRPVLHILTLFQTKTCHFPPDQTSKIHTSFQTWRWSHNATYMFTKTEIHFEFAHYIMGLYLNHLEPIDKYVHTPQCSSLENYTRFQSNGQSL